MRVCVCVRVCVSVCLDLRKMDAFNEGERNHSVVRLFVALFWSVGRSVGVQSIQHERQPYFSFSPYPSLSLAQYDLYICVILYNIQNFTVLIRK